ncbi:MAG: hypothetical protein ACI8QS_001171 [Planctomycetota bacterium]|jgi:hypothetical protein
MKFPARFLLPGLLMPVLFAHPQTTSPSATGSQDTGQASPFQIEDVEVASHGRAGMPAPVLGADGVLRMSWVERHGGGEARLLLSTFGEDGFGPPHEVARGDDWFVNWADFPTTSALADGSLLAVWMRMLGEGTFAYGIQFSLSHDGGTSWSDPAWLHDDLTPAEHGFVSIVPLDESRFMALWLDGRDSTTAREFRAAGATETEPGAQQLWSRTIGSDGTLGIEMPVDDRVCDCCGTSLVRTGTGEVVAAWRDRSEGEVRDIYSARFDGKTWSRGQRVHRDNWVIPGCPVNGPRLAWGQGRLACAWHTGGETMGSFVALGADADSGIRPAEKGARFGLPSGLDNGTSAGRVDALFLSDGSLLVTWMEHAEDEVLWRGRLIDRKGRSGPPQTIAPTSSDRATGFLRAAPFGDGALLAWTDPDSGTVLAAMLTLN